jgi:hypothetical protein
MFQKPEQKIEEQLEAFARRRRREAGAEFAIPRGTRDRLQEEVARRYSTAASSASDPMPSSSWVKLPWPRLALGGLVVFGILWLCVLVLWQEIHSPALEQLAMRTQPATPDPGAVRQEQEQEQDVKENLAPHPRSSTVVLEEEEPRQESLRRSLSGGGEEKATSHRGVRLAKKLAEEDQTLLREGREASLALLAHSEVENARVEEPGPLQNGFSLQPAGSPPGERSFGLSPAVPESAPAASDSLGVAPTDSTSQTSSTASPRVPVEGIVRARNRAVGQPVPGQSNPTVPALETASAGVELRSGTSRKADPALTAGKEAQDPNSNAFYFSTYPDQDQNRLGSQRFTQVPNHYRRNFNSPPRPRVLNEFQAQQIGQRLLITDYDGSTYQGSVQEAAELPGSGGFGGGGNLQRPLLRSQESLSRQQAGAASGASAFSNALFFRVSGTNRTLNQRVVFEGNYLPVRNFSPAAAGQAGVHDAYMKSGVAANSSLLSLGRIEGKATIGGTNHVPIEALPVSP